MKNLSILYILLSVLIWACGSDTVTENPSDNAIQEVPAEGKISSIIRNPQTASGDVDTVNIAKIEFENDTYDFGEIDQGGIVEHTFKFKNTGKVPLIISSARSTCGCTVPEYPEEPIEAGADGEIYVKFNTAGKKNRQSKPVTITANTYPNQTQVFVKGYVNVLDKE